MRLLKFSTLFSAICTFIVPSMVYGAGSTANNSPDSSTIFQDFRAVLMYFSEAFLSGATFGSHKLEGELAQVMNDKFVYTLKCLENKYAPQELLEDPKLKRLVTFRKELEAGCEVAQRIDASAGYYDFTHRPLAAIEFAKLIQNVVKAYLNTMDRIIIPIGWVHHGTAFVIERSKTEYGINYYNLAFINTGNGLEHHYTQPDPNNVYPYLDRLWIEFHDIPQDLIFEPETAWLFYGLASINDQPFAERLKNSLKNGFQSLPNYFYDSLLANFRKYLVKPEGEKITEKLFPAQQSGSCSISKLMGALLYYSDSMKDFHWYRLKIGHVLLENFLKRLEPILSAEIDERSLIIPSTRPSDENSEFMGILRNAFFSGGIRLFRGLIRALANLQLQYLEHQFPEEFMHAGLIGSERSKWITDKKDAAIRKLEADETARFELQKTLHLAKAINTVVSSIKYRESTTRIQDLSEIHGYFQYETIYFESAETDEVDPRVEFKVTESQNILRNIVGVPERLEVGQLGKFPIDTFEEFYNDFNSAIERKDNLKDVYYMRFLDIFRRLYAGAGWSIIHNHKGKAGLERLQEMCKKVAIQFAELPSNFKDSYRKPSMDEATLLGHLQLLTWYIFRALHNLYDSTGAVNWDALAPPSTIQETLLIGSFGGRCISGDMENWTIKGFLDVENYRLYNLFIEESCKEVDPATGKCTVFPGPDELVYLYGKPTINREAYEKYMSDKNISAVFGNFVSIPEVKNVLMDLKVNELDWNGLDENYAKFLIVLFAGEELLYDKIPYYYNFMYTLHFLRLGVAGEGFKEIYNSEKFWLIPSKKAEDIEFTYEVDRHTIHHQTMGNALQLIKRDISSNELFYLLRHSYALAQDVSMTDVDTWFNYIKNAKSSKVFNNTRFQYMTDHLLNVPKYKQKSDEKVLLFNSQSAKKIIPELMKLIRSSFMNLLDDSGKMAPFLRTEMVRRAVNISVITTRFISLVDYEFGDSEDFSSYLVDLYNILEPYSYFNSDILKLRDDDISMINFALSHMCFTRLNNPESFTNAINLGFDYRFRRHRRTLARVHWFMAKLDYTLSSEETIADDQFKYGFPGSPLKVEEIRFFEALLNEKFLRHYYKKESNYSFRYDTGGYVVEITSDKLQDRQLKLLINLATGTIIENDMLRASKSPFLNSLEFKAYFSDYDQKHLSTAGKSYVIYGKPVLMLPTIHRSDYFMIQDLDKFWLFRKWDGDWYIWRPKDVCRPFFDALGYIWKGNFIKMFKKYKSTWDQDEMLIFNQGGKDPILKITKTLLTRFFRKYDYKVTVPGLTDKFPAKIIKQLEYREMHLREFAGGGATYSRHGSDHDGTVVVVYNNHRLPDDPLKPFVITSASENKLRVLNVPNMEICKDQVIGRDGLGLPGTLVAEFDGKKLLLVPFAEVLQKSSNSIMLQHLYIKIEKIPMDKVSISETEDVFVPAPQSRMHKLLLAYYMILAQNYDSARKLLHPSTSIHHNSMFNAEELQIIYWILRIEMESPEYNALALVTYSHFLINDAKFTFDYTEVLSNIAKNIRGVSPQKTFTAYMMSIRELSEKYYIFKMFPEILSEDSVLSKVFFRQSKSEYSPNEDSEDFEFPVVLSSNLLQFTFGERQTINNLIHIMNAAHPSHPALKLIKYLLVRRNSCAKFDTGLELVMYCYIEKPDIWTEFRNILGKNGANFDSKTEELVDLFDSTIKNCEEFKVEFNGVSLRAMSERTNLKKIQETMRNDSGVFEGYLSEDGRLSITIDTSEEANELIAVKNNLMNCLNTTANNRAAYKHSVFDSSIVGSSNVLGSLYNSIDLFIDEKKINDLSNLDSGAHECLLSEIRSLEQTLERRIYDLQQEQKILGDMLIQETQAGTDELPHSHSIENLFSMMHQRKRKTFSDLYACYLKNSLSCIQSKFPQLNDDQCMKVKSDSVLFFSRSILLDYFKSIQKSAQNFMKTGTVPVDDLTIFVNELEKISDFSDRIKDPVIMNFEFRSKKYRLKSEQVKDIELLTSEESDNFKSVVIQRMMAAGKTLVLGTISVVMKALKRNDRLSILVPPSSLYQSNTTDMQNRTYHYFKKRGNSFSFPRLPLASNTQTAKKLSSFLENVISIINHTMTSRNYLILSPDHLQSFLNSYIEAIEGARVLCKGEHYSDYIGILKKFATIYQIFKEKSSIILDEIDMTMDPKKELNFPTIDTENYNLTAVAMIADVIEFMLFDQKIKAAGLDIFANNQAALTPKNYKKCKFIVLNYIKSQLQDETSLWRKFVPENESENTMKFLLSESISDKRDWIEKLADDYHTATLAKALVIVKTQLHLHLEEFFGATVNQNYGMAGPLRPNIKYAVPYVAANTPSAGSVFADRWETLVKTIIMISASPCSIETAKDVIKYVRKSIVAESANDPKLDLKSLPTSMNMALILPENIEILTLDENDDSHVAIVHDALISRSPAAIRVLYSYYIDEVMSKMEFPVDQITSNALHMALMFASVQGYSGTINNVNILSQRVVAEAHKDHEENEKNNGGIALKLIQDFKNEIIPEFPDESFTLGATEMVRDFFEIFEKKAVSIDQISAIIDTGAFFKNFTNKAVAKAILDFFNGRIKAVLFYDETTNQLKFIRGVFDSGNLISASTGLLETTDPGDIETITQAKVDERFTFYDQRHITGSDILQPKFALAIMTAGPRVLLRDLLQGSLRMRQFMTSQKVHLIVTESLRKFYISKIKRNKKSIRVSDLITLGSLNEDEKQIQENEKLAFGKIDAEIRSFVLDEISKLLAEAEVDQAVFDRIMALYHENRDLFIRSIKENPLSWLHDRKPQNTAEVLQQHVDLRLEKLSPLFQSEDEIEHYNDLTRRLELMYKTEYKNRSDSLLNYLKDEIIVRTDETIGTEIVMQNQVQSLTLMDMNLDQLLDRKPAKATYKAYTFDLLNRFEFVGDGSAQSAIEDVDFYSLFYIYKQQPESKKEFVNSVLLTDGKRIGVTTDLVQLYTVPSDNSNNFPIFSKYTMEGTHFLVFSPPGNPEKYKILLLSPKHAAKVFADLKSESFDDYQFWLCDLFGDVTVSNSQSPFVQNILNAPEFGPNLKRSIFDLLVFNGSFPQILTNSELRKLYENEWMTADKFRNRAMFLRLRMKALADKGTVIFDEDHQDYSKLVKYSCGDFRKDTGSSIFVSEYAKTPITEKIQSSFKRKVPSLPDKKSSSTGNEFNFTLDMLKTHLAGIFQVIASSGADNESFVNLSKIRPVFEPGSCEEQFEEEKSSEMDDKSEISNDQTPPRDGSGSDSYDADQSLNPPSGNNHSRSSTKPASSTPTNKYNQLPAPAPRTNSLLSIFMIFIAISAVVLVIAIVIGMHLKAQSHDENESLET